MSTTNTSTDSHGFRHIGHSDLGGYGDGMQVMREGDALYVGHFGPSGMGTSVLDVSDPTAPRLVRQWPAPHGSHTHKVQVAGGLLLTNQEQFRAGDPWAHGMAVYSLEDPLDPRPIGYFDSTGKGVHRIVWEGGRYAYISAIPDGFDDRIWVIVDLSDPEHPVEAGRWWWPGMWTGGGETPDWPESLRYAAHHALISGDRAYLGYDFAGMVILDISDPTAPRRISGINWTPGGSTHTCLPLPDRGLVVVTDEAIKDRGAEPEKYIRIIDVADELHPKVLSVVPEPPREDFVNRGLRFGPHNLHENRPGTYRSDQLVFATYFNAGLRAYDLTDPARPTEIAHWLPPVPAGQEAVQANDLFVDAAGLVYVTDRVNGGVDILEPEPWLAQRMQEARLPEAAR